LAAVVAALTATGGGSVEPPAAERSATTSPPAAQSRSLPGPMVVVGFDGLDWVLLDRLIGEGRCPTFARIRRDGAWANLASHSPLVSPLVWTSIGTGRRPEVHGIVDFVVRDAETGHEAPVGSGMRRVHAFWNVLSAAGRSVNVVGWWATFPAEPINGVMVSERPFTQLAELGVPRLEPGDVHPPHLLSEVRANLVPIDEVGFEVVRDYVDLDRAEFERRVAAASGLDNPYQERVHHLRKIIAATRGVFNLGRWLVGQHPADLTALYVEGTDTIGHRFAPCLPPRLSWVDEGDYRMFRRTMERYYELCDRELGQLMAAAPADTTWIVTADHGFHTGAARPAVPADDFGGAPSRWHRLTGVFMAMGPHVKPGPIDHADIYDLCRTLLWLQGAPVSDELEGRELVELMDGAWAAERPPQRVASYQDLPRPWQSARVPAAGTDRESLDELRALGYVTGDEAEAAAAAGPTESDTAEINRAFLAQERGDVAAAIRHLEKALEIRPDSVHAMLELSEAYRRSGDVRLALGWLAKALETDHPALPTWIPVVLVRESIVLGRLEGALQVLGELPERWKKLPSYQTALGIAALAVGRKAEARAAFESALAMDPAELDAFDGIMRLREDFPDLGWEAHLKAAHGAVETDLRATRRLAWMCASHGLYRDAESCLRAVLASDPNDTYSLRGLALTLHALGRDAEAAEVEKRCPSSAPGDPDALTTPLPPWPVMESGRSTGTVVRTPGSSAR